MNRILPLTSQSGQQQSFLIEETTTCYALDVATATKKKRGPGGRPRLAKAKKKRASIQVFVTDAEKAEIERLAQIDLVSVSAWGRWAVVEKLEQARRRRRRSDGGGQAGDPS